MLSCILKVKDLINFQTKFRIIDKLTKIVLTIIAINLTILTFRNVSIFPIAYANEPINQLDVNHQINYGLVPLQADGTVLVKLSNDNIMDVRLRSIDEAADLRWESIPVRLVNE